MNRTVLLFATAGFLAVVALFVSPRITFPSRPVSTPVVPPLPTRPGSLSMEARFSHPLLPPGLSQTFLTVDVKGVDLPSGPRRPVQLALVIDRSGSMAGEKLAHAKAAARQLIAQLGPEDSLSLVHYGSDVEVVPSRPMTAAHRETVLAAVNRIEDSGGTNISDALAEAGKTLAADSGLLRRVILVSDGQPTEGETDPRALSALAHKLRQSGVSVSAIGVGTDFNEDLMQAIAELGAGSYGYLRDSAQLANLFSRDLQQATTRVARGVELSLELPAGVSLGSALGYRATQDGRTVRIPLPDFSARQLESVVVALNVSAAEPGTKMPVAGVGLSYDDLLSHASASARASLDAEVTTQLAQVAANEDKRVAVAAARAQSALNVVRAADALREGRKTEAKAYLSANAPLFEKAAKVAGAGAVAQDLEAQKVLADDFATAAAPAEIADRVKGAKRKALQDLGKQGSVY